MTERPPAVGRGDRTRRGGATLLALGLAAAALLLPARAAAQEAGGADTLSSRGPVFGRSYALLAHDTGSGTLGMVGASTEFSVSSGGAHLDPGAGAVFVQGQGTGAAGRRILDALRQGRSPAAALSAVTGEDGAVQAAALTPACDRDAEARSGAGDGVVSRAGRAGGICYVALGVRLRPAAGLDLLVRSFESAGGPLVERLLAALTAVEEASRSVGGSRSAVLWTAASDTADPPLGRSEIRLQVEDHERPALALERRLRVGRADWLSRRASRAVGRGEYERAVALADSSLDLDLSAPMAWLQRGRALLYRGREEAAEEAFRRTLELDPYLLRLLGDVSGGEITVREDVIPYYPRMVLRLDLFRREYFDDLDFGPEPEPFVTDTAAADTTG